MRTECVEMSQRSFQGHMGACIHHTEVNENVKDKLKREINPRHEDTLQMVQTGSREAHHKTVAVNFP